MVDTWDAVFAFVAAGLITWAMVPPAERLAIRVGALDHPGPRSQHTVATPRMSGLAILAGIQIAGWIWLPHNTEATSILLGALMVCFVGALDDVFDLPALVKLIGQMLGAAIPVAGGVHPDLLTIPFIGGFELGWTAWPLTILGIVAVINIINLMDGIDGLAA